MVPGSMGCGPAAFDLNGWKVAVLASARSWTRRISGTEQAGHRNRPQPAMVEAGADMIFGHHAHRLQPMSFFRGDRSSGVLGNFVWPAFSSDGSTTAVAQVTVGAGGRFSATLLPARIVSDGQPVLSG